MNFAISGPSVTVGSDAGTMNGPFEEFLRPFTFTGQLRGYASADRGGTPVFDLTLAGSGMARLSMAVEDGGYSFSSLHYNFDPAPVPEPATLLLVGAGAALVGRKAWRRRSTQELP